MTKLLIAVLATATLGTGMYLTIDNSPTHAEAENQQVLATTATSQEKPAANIEKVMVEADFLKVYNNIDELAQKADIIIEGNVLESVSFDYYASGNDTATVLTKSKVQVTKSYSPKVNVGDILTFIEPGGVTTKKALGIDKKMNLPQERWGDKVEVINNIPTMKPNEKVVIFGSVPDPNFNVVNEPHYWVLGSHQGKFNITNGFAERGVPNDMKAEGFSSLKMSESEMDQQIKASLAKKATN